VPQLIEALHRLIPASTVLIPNTKSISADRVLQALDAQGIIFKMNRMSSGDWDIEASDLNDMEILSKIHIESARYSGMLLICTEACSRYGHPIFQCNASDFSNFVRNYSIEMFFDGDVIIVCEQTKTITIFHHSGYYSHVTI